MYKVFKGCSSTGTIVKCFRCILINMWNMRESQCHINYTINHRMIDFQMADSLFEDSESTFYLSHQTLVFGALCSCQKLSCFDFVRWDSLICRLSIISNRSRKPNAYQDRFSGSCQFPNSRHVDFPTSWRVWDEPAWRNGPPSVSFQQ